MHMRKYKVGDFAIVNGNACTNNGDKVRVDKYNQYVNGHHCWYVVAEDGYRFSVSEICLDEAPEEKVITLEQVVAAKSVVDKAQKMFVELLSKYQLQEASK